MRKTRHETSQENGAETDSECIEGGAKEITARKESLRSSRKRPREVRAERVVDQSWHRSKSQMEEPSHVLRKKRKASSQAKTVEAGGNKKASANEDGRNQNTALPEGRLVKTSRVLRSSAVQEQLDAESERRIDEDEENDESDGNDDEEVDSEQPKDSEYELENEQDQDEPDEGSSDPLSPLASVMQMARRRPYRRTKRPSREPQRPCDLVLRRSAELSELGETDFSKWPCCKKKQCFRNVDSVYFREQRKIMLKASQVVRKDTLRAMLRENHFYFNGKPVCTSFLIQGFGFSKDLQRSVKGTPLAPAPPDSGRSRLGNVKAVQRESISSFLRSLADTVADKMPDTGEKHLPFLRKTHVYDLLTKQWWTDVGREKSPPTFPYFIWVWNKYHPKIKVRKVTRFSKCDVCEMTRDGLSKHWKDREKVDDIKRIREGHIMEVQIERGAYQGRIDMAVRDPARVCSIIVDGADQKSFGIPHFPVNTKGMTGEALKVRLVGVLEHMSVPELSLYTLTEEFETGANHVIEVIHRWLDRKTSKGPLPEILYLQVDNTTRENKNRYLFSYLECLVAWGVFREIQTSFLPVGHTHADIDQRFSCTSKNLKTAEFVTLPQLHSQLRQSFANSPIVSHLRNVANISSLFEKKKVLRVCPTFSEYRYFRFCTAVHERAVSVRGTGFFNTSCSVKRMCDDGWKPLFDGDERKGFLLRAPHFKDTPPTKTRAPDNISQVNMRIASSESIINDTKSLEELQRLKDSVYNDRQEQFHWDLESCVEGKAIEGHFVRSQADLDENENDIIPYTRLPYERSTFVAIRPKKPTRSVPFWVGQIRSLIKNKGGDVVKLYIQYYGNDGDDVCSGKYTPQYLDSGKPWNDKVSTESVIYKWNRLNADNRLGSQISRGIMEQTKTYMR